MPILQVLLLLLLLLRFWLLLLMLLCIGTLLSRAGQVPLGGQSLAPLWTARSCQRALLRGAAAVGDLLVLPRRLRVAQSVGRLQALDELHETRIIVRLPRTWHCQKTQRWRT
jgi:hypothetical protein